MTEKTDKQTDEQIDKQTDDEFITIEKKELKCMIIKEGFLFSMCFGSLMGWSLVQVVKYGASISGFLFFLIVWIIGMFMLNYKNTDIFE